MDYEKAYKESFEAAKGLHEAGNALTKKQMEIVFPQLAESEDDRIRKRISLCLDECVHSDIIRDYERDECLAYLEKQKEQKPAEWSEEDEEIFNNIIEKAKGGHWIEVNEITWLIARFKSLRNRVSKESLQSWKPSEEQMKWLKDVLETVPMTCRQQVPLESLYNDLLKLANDCINTYHRTFIQEL